jgi:hypothetical protein
VTGFIGTPEDAAPTEVGDTAGDDDVPALRVGDNKAGGDGAAALRGDSNEGPKAWPPRCDSEPPVGDTIGEVFWERGA